MSRKSPNDSICALCSVVTQLAAAYIYTLLSVDILDTSTHHKDVIVHHSRQLRQTGPSHLCGGGGCVSIISTNDCIYMLCAVWELLCNGQNDENLISLSPSQNKKPPDQDVCPENHLTNDSICVLCSVVTQLAAAYIYTLLSVDILDISTHHKDVIVHHSRQLPQTGPSHLCGGGGCVSIISTNDCIYAVWEVLWNGQNDENLLP